MRMAAKAGRAQAVLKALRLAIGFGVVVYLVYRLSMIGWNQLLAAMPTNPTFYLLFLVSYLLLPISQVLNYRITWQFNARRSFGAFMLKRVYNRDVLDYSGELYFYTWARNTVGRPDLELLKTIRDQNIVSSIASTTMAFLLLAVLLRLGHISVTELVGGTVSPPLVAGVAIAVMAILTLTILVLRSRLRHYVFSMTARVALIVFAVHAARLVLGQVVQIGQWTVGVPGVPLGVWCMYAAASIIVSRIPLLPGRDLVFLGVGVGMAEGLDVPTAAVSSMLLVNAVLSRVLNLCLFVLLWFRSPKKSVEVTDASGEVGAT